MKSDNEKFCDYALSLQIGDLFYFEYNKYKVWAICVEPFFEHITLHQRPIMKCFRPLLSSNIKDINKRFYSSYYGYRFYADESPEDFISKLIILKTTAK